MTRVLTLPHSIGAMLAEVAAHRHGGALVLDSIEEATLSIMATEPISAEPAPGFGKAHGPGNRTWPEKGKRERERRLRRATLSPPHREGR